MAYQTLRLTSGVNVEETQALNEASISTSQLVRFKPDPKGSILVEKLGGWARFYPSQITSPVRATLAWEDTNAQKWFAYGTSNLTSATLAAVQCQTDVSGNTTASGTQYNLTPRYLSDSTPAIFQTTKGSSSVTVTDNTITGLSYYDSVFISTPVSVGGLILFGQYNIQSSSGPTYVILATNTLGDPAYAAYDTVASAVVVTNASYSATPPATITYTYGALASAPFTAGENVNVTGVVSSGPSSAWNNSCIVTASTTTTTTVLAPPGVSGTWTSGGLLSNYGVVPVLSATTGSAVVNVTFPDHGYQVGSTFTVLNQTYAGSISLYGNYLVSSVTNSYTFSINASSSSTTTTQNWLNALTVVGGSSTISAVTLNLGQSTYALPSFTVISGSSTTTHVTLGWTSTTPYTYIVGQSITVVGANPVAWNGTYTITSVTSTSVTYALSGSALAWVSGGVIETPLFNLGSQITVSGANPSAWNGVFTVTNSTPTTVTYALTGSALAWVAGGVVSDIGGDVDYVYNISVGPPVSAGGWGSGGWGAGGWGTGATPSQTVGVPIFASTWSLDNWGEVLIADPIGFTPIDFATGTNLSYGPLYAWEPTLQQPYATVITAGPPASNGFFVAMPQRQIVAWGTTFGGIIDPLLVRWCDVSNFNVWIGKITNQAGSYRISTGSAIIGAMQAQQQGLIWTDIGLWSMQYIGPPYVYSFNQIAQGCGLIARRAVGVMNNIIYWMGSRQFFTYSGNGAQAIVCPVWDAVYQQLDLGNVDKITIAVNSQFQEITWYYPVIGGTGDNSNYVRFSALTNMWDLGVLGRTSWLDNSVLGPPIGYDPVNQYIYQHEISPDADGQVLSASFTTGYFAVSDAQYKVFLDEVWPDFKWGYYNQDQGAHILLTFKTADFPGDRSPSINGPFSLSQSTQWINPRFRARLISITIRSNDLGSFWRIGAIRYRASIDGRY